MNRNREFTSLKQEFLRVDRVFLVYLATIIIYLSIFKDISRVGFRPEWLAIRLGYLPFILGARYLAQTKLKKFYELPVWAAGFYITSFCTYFSLSAGPMGSDYLNGLIQFYFGIAIMPITAATFYGFVALSLSTYIIANLTMLGAASLPQITTSNIAPLFIFSSIVYFITSRIRANMIRSQNELAESLSVRESVIEEQSKKLADAETKAALGRMTAQIAHDICSPIAALDVLINDIGEIPADKRQILKSVHSRMQDITNGLLLDYRRSNATSSHVQSAELASSLLETIVSEKRIELRPRLGVKIALSVESITYGLFVSVQPVEFKRVLSNLINNAAEAIRDKDGDIRVALSGSREKVTVTVVDSGRGIQPDALARLNSNSQTESIGKKTGSGLGLAHAKDTITRWGGSFRIESVIDVGTKVTIELPRATAPAWFVERISLEGISTIIMVDDDMSIHHLWEDRLKDLAGASAIEKIHISSPMDLKNARTKIEPSKTLFLVDQDFTSTRITGLDLIEELGIAAQSILVTSHFEEKSVRERADRLGIKLIPKMLAASIPFLSNMIDRKSVVGTVSEFILIDNDPIIREVWQSSARDNNVRLRTFESVEQFQRESNDISREATLYLDSDLGNGLKGETLAAGITKLGFKRLMLATSYAFERATTFPGVQEIVGKSPPWLIT